MKFPNTVPLWPIAAPSTTDMQVMGYYWWIKWEKRTIEDSDMDEINANSS